MNARASCITRVDGHLAENATIRNRLRNLLLEFPKAAFLTSRQRSK